MTESSARRFHRESTSEETGGSDVGEMDGSTTITLSNPSVLDCPLCFKPFTAPVYQCPNGHATCAYCYVKIQDKCPSCFLKMGSIRCLALESVLESTQIACSYNVHGCPEKLRYDDQTSHEYSCSYAPFPCPLRACKFRGSRGNFHLHLVDQHEETIVPFRFNSVFSVSMAKDGHSPIVEDDLIILLERDGTPFFVKSENSTIRVGCSDGRFGYAVVFDRKPTFQLFQSYTKNHLDDTSSSDFMQIPGYFFDSGSVVRLGTCIWDREGDNPESSRSAVDLIIYADQVANYICSSYNN